MLAKDSETFKNALKPVKNPKTLKEPYRKLKPSKNAFRMQSPGFSASTLLETSPLGERLMGRRREFRRGRVR